MSKKITIISVCAAIICFILIAIPVSQDMNHNTAVQNSEPVNSEPHESQSVTYPPEHEQDISMSDIPEYSGKAYVEINNNHADTDIDFTTATYEEYALLDSLSRPVYAKALVDSSYMPGSKRESIAHIKPAGWHTYRYDDLISDKYLYNRCHLIGFQLTGENDNEKNLITGTRFMNLAMVPFENQIADYMKSNPDSLVYIEVTPIYTGDNLLCDGLHYQALSEDKNLDMNLYFYNVQPGVIINYSDGTSKAA